MFSRLWIRASTRTSRCSIGANCRAPPVDKNLQDSNSSFTDCCIWRLPPAVLCCHSDCQSGSDWLAGVVASRLMLDGLAECRPSSFPASLSDDYFPAVHDVQAFPESFGWRGVCANLHSKAVEDVVAFVVVSCDVADTCVWNI